MIAAAPPPAPENPCREPARHLVCPNLRMPPATDLHIRSTRGGRTLLLMANRLVNVGPGELEFRGRRYSSWGMDARQIIARSGGRSRLSFETGAKLYFKYVDARRGAYWKFQHAARFELWRLDGTGHRTRLLRTGPKLDYCLRDLFRRRSTARTSPHYPACSQSRPQRQVTLGVSVGWADGYPSTYPENWVDVTGRRGCVAIVQRADPLNHILETDETDNVSVRVVRLPLRHGPQHCPRYRGLGIPSAG